MQFVCLRQQVGAGCAAYVTIMGFVAFFGQDRGVAAYVFIVGVFISPMELPLLCNKCWPWVNEMMLTSLNLNNWLLRGILYVLLTFIMFLGDDVTILAGVGLMFSGELPPRIAYRNCIHLHLAPVRCTESFANSAECSNQTFHCNQF